MENNDFFNVPARTISQYVKKRGLARLRELCGWNHPLKLDNDRFSAIAATAENPWSITGASVTGHGHRLHSEPCQDAHLAQVWGNGWGAVAVSDGAGSALRSQLASSLLVRRAVRKASRLVSRKGWAVTNKLPALEEWRSCAEILMRETSQELPAFAERKKIPLHELYATLIVMIFSPHGILTTHIGDGRAGCLDLNGNYHALMEPWEGEQVGQTVFVTMGNGNIRNITGASVFNAPVKSFFLLTDGCERVSWETLAQDHLTGSYKKRNKPFAPFFDQTIKTLSQMYATLPADVVAGKWHNYLDNGHKDFVTEPDDKTMVIGIVSENPIHRK
ncbi:MAG TPA: PP2C family serine/threonine-protein phosphatase [Bacteroidales bacterium]|nr:PP2C family serine/threonine-protein phosphatase [Bacteroidales bacterium]